MTNCAGLTVLTHYNWFIIPGNRKFRFKYLNNPSTKYHQLEYVKLPCRLIYDEISKNLHGHWMTMIFVVDYRKMRVSLDSLKLVVSWKGGIQGSVISMKIGGLQLEGCTFDGSRLSDNQRDSPSVAAVPPCVVAFIPKVISRKFPTFSKTPYMKIFRADMEGGS